MPRYFEDLAEGDFFESPHAIEMTHDDIVAFASEYDPQLFHIDDEAGRRSPVGALSASAFHTLCIGHKLAHESGVFDFLPVIGLGISEFDIPRPVVAGDRLRTRVTVRHKRESSSKPTQGVVKLHVEVFNQDGYLSLQYVVSELVYKRPL